MLDLQVRAIARGVEHFVRHPLLFDDRGLAAANAEAAKEHNLRKCVQEKNVSS